MSKATICIITCRRPEGLKRLLEALILQQVSPETALDIIVVDNACEQRTADVVTEIQTKTPYLIHYYEESEPGIVAARNKCVKQFLLTDSSFLFFIDDDEWPESNNWAQKILDAQIKYQADVISSHVISIGEKGTPEWATQLLYGDNKLVEGQKISKYYTNNLLISRTVLETVVPAFDSRFAMTGASDYHFSLKCSNLGYSAFYTDAPVVEEFPKSRATLAWFARRGYRSGVGFTRSHLFEDKIYKAIPFCLLMAGTRLIRGLISLIFGVVSFNKLRIMNGLFRLSSFAGSLSAFFGGQYQEYKTIHGK
ncbi:MAG: glycosyltransferase family 2 protein [Thiotrichaceae bacterium]|nr:glycosyltransferase family 2 protein [Thiotrichaceae bacterium]